MPVGIEQDSSGLMVLCFMVRPTYFRDPFFIDSLKRYPYVRDPADGPKEEDYLLVRPLHYDESNEDVVRIPAQSFIDQQINLDVETNLGFIFHISRCGSTLVTQMLSSSDRFFVLSEPSIINSLLDPSLEIEKTSRAELLRASMAALRKVAPERVDFFFLKFRSWNIFCVDTVLAAFPRTSWIFLHRNGLEVLSSLLAKPPGWLRARANCARYFSEFLGVDASTVTAMDDDEFIARMLGSFCRIAMKHSSPSTHFLDYIDLKKELIELLRRAWGIVISENDARRVLEASKIYSKDTEKRKEFVPDSEAKRSAATPHQIKVVEEFAESERRKILWR